MASSNYPQGSKENPHSLSSYDYLLKICAADIEAFEEKLLEQVSFAVHSGEKVALVGANGTGKTSMLREIWQNQNPAIHFSEAASPAFFSQLHAEILKEQNTIYEELFEVGFETHQQVEEYLQKYYKNTKMCEKLFGTEEYEFGCESVEDNNLRAQKLVDYIINEYGYGKRIAVFSHHGMLEYLIPTALGVKTRDFFFFLRLRASSKRLIASSPTAVTNSGATGAASSLSDDGFSPLRFILMMSHTSSA